MKNLKIAVLLVSILSVNSMFAQEQKTDTIKDNLQMLYTYSVLKNLNKNVDNGQSYGITYLYGKVKPNGFISKVGFDVRFQTFGTSKSIDFNRDSLWTSNYTTPHKAGAMNNGIANFQFGVPISIGYAFKLRDNKDRLEVNLGVTTYYSWSELYETTTITDKGATFEHGTSKNLFFIQQPINFNANASINYIANKYWVIGLNSSYAMNSLYKVNYMQFNPFSIGVSVGFNINNYNVQTKK